MSPVVCSDFLFAKADIAQLLADTQVSSLLRSQQALVDVAARDSGGRHQRFSPHRSPSDSSPFRRRQKDSG